MDAENDRRKAHGHHQTRGRFRLQKKRKKTTPPPQKKKERLVSSGSKNPIRSNKFLVLKEIASHRLVINDAKRPSS